MGCRQCPDCGAYLDPGERCDCRDSEQPQEEGNKKSDDACQHRRDPLKGDIH